MLARPHVVIAAAGATILAQACVRSVNISDAAVEAIVCAPETAACQPAQDGDKPTHLSIEFRSDADLMAAAKLFGFETIYGWALPCRSGRWRLMSPIRAKSPGTYVVDFALLDNRMMQSLPAEAASLARPNGDGVCLVLDAKSTWANLESNDLRLPNPAAQ
jgi:hypothetical protein